MHSFNKCFLKAFSWNCYHGLWGVRRDGQCHYCLHVGRHGMHASDSDSRGKVLNAMRKAQVKSCSCSQAGRNDFWAREMLWKRKHLKGVLQDGRIWTCRGGCEEMRKIQLQKNSESRVWKEDYQIQRLVGTQHVCRLTMRNYY